MSHLFLITLVLMGLATATPLRAQNWDAARHASGWAFQEADGSFLFFDPAARSLRTWMKGGGLLATLPVSFPASSKPGSAARPSAAPSLKGVSDYSSAAATLYGIPSHQRLSPTPAKPATPEAPASPAQSTLVPERWVLDSYNRVWMVCEGHLAVLGKEGAPVNILAIPAPVEDMAVVRDGILLLYRTQKPYLEKRDLKTGAILWAFGDKNQAKEAAAEPLRVPLNRMALGADDTIYIAEGASLAFTVLDPGKGPKDPGQLFFTSRDGASNRAVLGPVGRGPMLSWPGKDVIFGVFTPKQVRSCGAPDSKGLLLARFDLARGAMEWLPTSLDQGHRLVGLLDAEAVFVAPDGGLAYAPIH
jgi:hypothetical protein